MLPPVKRWAEPLALFVLLAVVGLRPTIQESFHTGELGITAALKDIQDPWAATTLVIDAIVLGVCALVLFRRSTVSPKSYVYCGLELGAAVLLIAAVLSCIFAGDKRPALNASIDLLSTIVLALTLVQLLDTRWKVCLLLAVVIGSGAANAAQCVEDIYSFKDTKTEYLQHRDEMWAEQGVSLDSPEVKLFEQRLEANEADGFFVLSNVAAGYMLLPAFAALGLTISSVASRRWEGVIAAVVVAALVVGIILTGSRGAFVGGICGILLLIVRVVWPGVFRRRGRTIVRVGWIVVAAGIALVIVVGVVRGGLPGSSLDFRWQYWKASARMFVHHPLVGVGAENFGDHYLRYKSITSPEEVKNPHDFIVQFATEYGTPGLIAVILLLGGGSLAASRFAGGMAQSSADGARGVNVRLVALWLAGIAAAIFLPRTFLLGSRQAALIVWMTSFGVLTWAGGAGLTLAALRSNEEDTAWRITLAALNCGLLAFLIQDTINFALFVPGARTTFLALYAASVAGRSPRGATPSTSRAQSSRTELVVVGAFVLCVVIALLPPLRAETDLRAARAAVRKGGPEAARAKQLYVDAARLDPLDTTAPAELTRYLVASAQHEDREAAMRTLTWALEEIRTAIDRSPFDFSLRRQLARILARRAWLSGNRERYDGAVAAMRKAIELYPERPLSYVELGDYLRAVGAPETIREAIDSYQKALDLNARRPEWEVYRRLSPEMIKGIHERIEQSQQMIAGAATQPGAP